MQNRRYPFLPVVVVVLQVIAALAFLVFTYMAISVYGQTFESWTKGAPSMYGMAEPVKGFLPRLQSLIQPTILLLLGLGVPGLVWGMATGMHALREIEFNTRKSQAEASAIQAAPVTDEVAAQ